MVVETPHSSLYHEIDFASKVVKDPSSSTSPNDIDGLIYTLSNAESSDVEKAVQGRRFYVRAMPALQGQYSSEVYPDHVGISLENISNQVSVGEIYT